MLDYDTSLMSKGFVFNNPNAKSTCGCGSSFGAVADDSRLDAYVVPYADATRFRFVASCGGGAPVDVHFCPQCTKILSLGRHGDYFAVSGPAPQARTSTPADLEQRFRALSRQFHPDYFYNATPAERRASLERSSYLNDAYRTLRDPVARVEYLLELEGFAPRGDRGGVEACRRRCSKRCSR